MCLVIVRNSSRTKMLSKVAIASTALLLNADTAEAKTADGFVVMGGLPAEKLRERQALMALDWDAEALEEKVLLENEFTEAKMEIEMMMVEQRQIKAEMAAIGMDYHDKESPVKEELRGMYVTTKKDNPPYGLRLQYDRSASRNAKRENL